MADNPEQTSSDGGKEVFTELDWINLKTEINSETLQAQETSGDKFMRKFKENPFVPIGCGLTAAALTYGIYSFTRGNKKTSQLMMRYRIAAQGFTVAALLVGIAKSMN